MTAVRFRSLGDYHVVTFAYDADVVAVLKTVPPAARSWDPAAKEWRILAVYAKQVAETLRHLGHLVTGLETGPKRDEADWARLLFARVGPSRSSAVFHALSRILHPDTGSGGDERLQQELNAAHAELKG